MSFRKGFPSIATPHGADQAIQLAINNIRARIDQLETALLAATGVLQQSVSNLSTTAATNTAPSTTTTTAGTYQAGVAITAGQAVYESAPGIVAVADPTILSQSYAVFGVAQTNAGPGANVTVATNGLVANVPSAGFAPSYPVFCGPGGALGQAPFNGYPALQVGVAVSATSLLVLPDQQLVTFMFNGATIGYRRQVNFIAGSGVTLTAADNPAANRVDVLVGQNVVVVPPAIPGDGWDWYWDSPEEVELWTTE